jgi:hypothetical protein
MFGGPCNANIDHATLVPGMGSLEHLGSPVDPAIPDIARPGWTADFQLHPPVDIHVSHFIRHL